MRFCYQRCITLLLALFYNIQIQSIEIRVLLNQIETINEKYKELCTIECASDVSIYSMENDKSWHSLKLNQKEHSKVNTPEHNEILKLNITIHDKKLCLNGKKLKDNYYQIKIKDKKFKINNNVYVGQLYIYYNTKKEQVLIINEVELEEYTASVLACETYASWPLEHHKAFAIVCRTFALHHKKEAERCKRIYHLKANSEAQHYKGLTNNRNIWQAVHETEGIILTYKNQPILAMYDICCGGVIPSHCLGFDFHEHPYLARPYACHHCADHKYYRWTITINHEKACDNLTQHTNQVIVKIHKIHIKRKSRTGAVQKVELSVTVKNKKNNRQRKTSITLNNKDLKKAFGISARSRSSCFTITLEKNDIIFAGSGRGHHLGLCQHGAKKLIDQGKTFKYVLSFYYPNTLLTQLQI